MCPRKQTTEPKLVVVFFYGKLVILVLSFSGEVTPYTDISYSIQILWEVWRSVFYGPPCIVHWSYVNVSVYCNAFLLNLSGCYSSRWRRKFKLRLFCSSCCVMKLSSCCVGSALYSKVFLQRALRWCHLHVYSIQYHTGKNKHLRIIVRYLF